MDDKMIFAVLGIEETKDENLIQSAYRMKLADNNPEDNPEGFRRLREAYEQALDFARRKEETDTQEPDNSLVGCWLQRVDTVYKHLSSRLDETKWQELLKEDICLDLEYAEEAKWRLFHYLADNFQLPADIYRVLDAFYGIAQQENDFKEHLPVPFVDYMLRKISDMEGVRDFPYQWIEGADDADYDQFQSRLYELEEYVAQKRKDEARQEVTVMEGLAIDHPYYRLAKAQLAVLEKDFETAQQMAEELLPDYPQNAKIQVLSAEVLYSCGKKDAAAAEFERIAENLGNIFLAEKYLALYEWERQNIAEAITHCLNALRSAGDEQLEALLPQMDNAYIASLKDGIENGTLSNKDAGRLMVSYVRTERAKEGLEFLNQYPHYIGELKRGHQYLAMLYYYDKQFEACIRESAVWRENVQKELSQKQQEPETEDAAMQAEQSAEDGEWTMAELKTSISLSFSYEGKSYMTLAVEKEEDNGFDALQFYKKQAAEAEKNGDKEVKTSKKEEDAFSRISEEGYEKSTASRNEIRILYEQAKYAFEQAKAYEPEYLNCRQDLLDTLIHLEDYTQAVEEADQILDINGTWFPAIAQKQKACYELNRAQEVIDLFYRAKEVYAEYYQIYELAARIFQEYRQLQDAENILKQAQEAQVKSYTLQVLELHGQRLHVQNEESSDVEWFELYKKASGMMSAFLREDVHKDVVAELYYELAIIEDNQLYEQFRHPGKAEEYIKRAVAIRDYTPYYYTAGFIVHRARQYKEALKYYEEYDRRSPGSESVKINMGRCCNGIGDWQKALDVCKDALAINPQNDEANRLIANIYKEQAREQRLPSLYYKALQYMSAQIQVEPDAAHNYISRSNIYKELNMWDEAIADIEKALSIDKKNPYALNIKGKLLFYTGKYQQALYYYKKAIDNLDNVAQDGWGMYTNAAKCCQKMGDYKQAIEWYEKGIKIFSGTDLKDYYMDMAAMFINMEQYSNACMIYDQAKKRKLIKEEEYRLKCLQAMEAESSTLYEARDLQMELQVMAGPNCSIAVLEELSDVQYYYVQDFEKGLQTKEQIMDKLKEQDADWFDHKEKIIERMKLYRDMGRQQDTVYWAQIYVSMLKKHYHVDTIEEAIEQYVADPKCGMSNLCSVISYFVSIGNMQQAANYVSRLEGTPLCRDCVRKGCAEYFEVLGEYYEALGNFEQAYENYRKGFIKDRGLGMCRLKTEQLGSKLGVNQKE